MVLILLLVGRDIGSISWQSSVDTCSFRSSIHIPLRSTEAACISVQENFCMHIVAREALHSVANSFQNREEPLTFKQIFLACIHKLEKVSISFRFGKKFLNSEKTKNEHG